MSSFATATAGPLSAEPDKRVHYTLGLVLGVDEFQQEQFYHMSGRRWHNRLLHGYGTVHGLAVTTPEPGAADPELQVSPGVAVDPCGREICVPDTMCVRLNGWLDRHRPTLEELYPGGVDTLPLAVVLCYRECETDVVPVPGEPCRTQEDAMQASRLRDSFELRLALREESLFGSPPEETETGLHLFRYAHAEEEAVRAFGGLLAGVETVSVAAPGAGRAELLAAVRALGDPEGDEASPPASPPGSIVLAEDEAPDAFREAFRVWVTEVRPAIRAREPGGVACDAADDECCVLLAEVDMPVTAGWAVGGVAFEPIEENRPILLHTRLLQEWLELPGGGSGNDDTFATLEPVTDDTIRVWLHYPLPLELAPEDVLASMDGGAPEAPVGVTPAGGADNVFDVQLSAAPADGVTVELRFDLTTIQVVDSPAGSLADALHSEHGGLLDRYGTEVRAYTVFRIPSVTLADYTDDLSGTHPNATVIRIQGRDVADADPDDGDVLTWVEVDGEWAPAALPAVEPPVLPPGEGDVGGTYPDLDVVGLRNRPIAAAAPSTGQVLTWSGTAWRPATPTGTTPDNVVTTPVPGYSVEAAGYFDRGGAPLGPTLNRMRVTPLGIPGNYNIEFDGYRPPDGEGFTYIVKGTAQGPERGIPVVVHFVAFFEKHLRIHVGDFQGEGEFDGFMVEISRIVTREA